MNPYPNLCDSCTTHLFQPLKTLSAAWLVCLAVLSVYAGATEAATIQVETIEQKVSNFGGCSLQEAIWAANLNESKAVIIDSNGDTELIDTGCVLVADGHSEHTIVLPGNSTFLMSSVLDDPFNYVGPTATPMVLASIIIEANGAVIQHAPNNVPFRAFAVGVQSFATDVPILTGRGALTIRNAHIRGFSIKGGNGAYGGGGGLGAGGAIYVHGGSLTLESSTFEGNSVTGGNGSRSELNTGGGGGGGLAGNGGRAGLPPQISGFDTGGGGGGGGGSLGDGGAGESNCGSPCLGLGAAGGGGGGTLESGADASAVDGSTGGFRCGGHGGLVDLNPLDSFHDGQDGTCAGGGGGGGRDSLFFLDPLQIGGNGGEGDYGGGGGGGAGLLVAGDGARGGFGGGGGASHASSNPPPYLCSPDGGDGGFGGGGGASPGGAISCPLINAGPGRGGSFAGNAGPRDGGGGAGLGGAIFNHSGSVLVINCTFTANGAARGVAGSWPNEEPEANSGQDQGAAIFSVGGSLTVINSTINGNEGTNSNNGGAGIVVYAPGFDIFSPLPQVPPTSFELHNTIIAGNLAGSVVTKECRLINSDSNSVQFTGSGNLITANDNCTPGAVSNADPQLGSLQLNPPGLTPTMKLGNGSPAIDAAVGNFPAYDQRGVMRPQGAAADIGAFELSSQPPTTTITLAPSAPNGANGWYVSAVGVTIIATDPEDDVAQTRCVLDPSTVPAAFTDLPDAPCALTHVSADGEHAIYAASIDSQGNMESTIVSVTFKLDSTDPSLSPSLNVPSPITVGQSGVIASPNASDTTSGVASSSCGVVDTSTPGAFTVSCTATDAAGNSATQDLAYVVEYRILGFFSPVPGSKWKVGQRVPVKIALANGAGERITDAEAAALAAACRVNFQASGAQLQGPDCMKYDAMNKQFIYTWKLAKNGTGAATILVRISYPGTTVKTELAETIMITR